MKQKNTPFNSKEHPVIGRGSSSSPPDGDSKKPHKGRNLIMKLKIPIKGTNDIEFYTTNGLLVARGYNRVVIGERGPYIEFSENQIIQENIFIPENKTWKINNKEVYYTEYRTKRDFVKIYLQKRLVKYADYRNNFYYISPLDLSTSWEKGKGKIVIKHLQLNLKKFMEV